MRRFVVQYNLDGRWIDSNHSYRRLGPALKHMQGCYIFKARVLDTKSPYIYPAFSN